MRCQYCNKRLSITRLLKMQRFCSAEHQELHLTPQTEALERLRESFALLESKEAEPAKPEGKREGELANLAQSLAEPVRPETKQEPPQLMPVAEPQAKAAQETLRTLDIASLVEAVEKTNGSDLSEARFLLEAPAPRNQPASALKSYAEEPISAIVRLPVSPTQGPSLRTSSSLVLDVSRVPSAVEATPAASQVAWRSVPQGYPPVVVSASATLVLDSNGADLIPLPMGEPCRGKGPIPTPQTDAIETPSRQPRLPSRQANQRQASEVSAFLDCPPQAPACDPSWKGRQGRGPALPPLAGMLNQQSDVARMVPPAKPENFRALPGFPFFAEAPAAPVPPKQIRVAAAAHLSAAIALRRALCTEKVPSTPRALALARSPSPQAIHSTTPLPCDPSFSEVNSAWLQIVVANELPRAATVLPAAPIGLSLAADAVPLECSSATNFPPSVETAAAVASPLPFLLLSRTLSIAAPALPLWSSTRPLWREACRLPAPVNEQQCAPSAAYLLPSHPSPWSLVTWAHSLSISLPACNPSNLARPALIGISANQGRTQALRPWSPSQRGYRLTPLLPQPNGIPWAPAAPMQASLRPPAIKPIRPGGEGTAPPRLATVRVQPASMPALPLASVPFGIESATGFMVLAASSEDTLKLACMDVAHRASRTAWELRAESRAVLPSVLGRRRAPAIGLAPCSHRFRWGAIPPVQTVSAIQPFSALKPLACSVTACLPGSGPTGLTQRQGWFPSVTSGVEARIEVRPY